MSQPGCGARVSILKCKGGGRWNQQGLGQGESKEGVTQEGARATALSLTHARVMAAVKAAGRGKERARGKGGSTHDW